MRRRKSNCRAWFKISFLDFRDDMKEAAAARKRLMLYFGQNGCLYCRRLMEVNFQQPDIVAQTAPQHFDVVEINILGSRDVTWLTALRMTEKDLARATRGSLTRQRLLSSTIRALS